MASEQSFFRNDYFNKIKSFFPLWTLAEDMCAGVPVKKVLNLSQSGTRLLERP